MADPHLVASPDATTPPRTRTQSATAFLGIALVVLVAVGGYVAGGASAAPSPGEDSAEVGFARDMSAHHSQAVEMAELLRPKTDDPEMQLLASDISLTQQAQIGQMSAWLDLWELPTHSTTGPMAWMGMPHDRMADMPGMASRAEIAELAQQQGPAAERTFLRLMISHHRSGVMMAEAVLQRSDEPVVRALADRIMASQQAEIDTMQTLLASRGGAVDDGGAADHEMSGDDRVERDDER